ncbi:MAG: MerR family transcriptional regulator [Lachnospiraceae bacterium]|nr:MerR family transcriptional regulator [Lachnospiraceae bacterium]
MENSGLFQIGEVSKLFHISISILRHYDKIGLVKPEYTDPKTGYRYYSTRQFECLNTIRYLRALDMPLEKIARFLQNRNIDSIRELLLSQKEEVKQRQQELEIIERKIENRLNQLEDALTSHFDEIAITKKPSRRIAAIKKQLAPKSYLDLEDSIRQIERSETKTVTFLGKVGVGISKQQLCRRQFGAYDLVFIILEEEDTFHGEVLLLPSETCVTLRFQGGHEQAAGYYEKLLNYIDENHYVITGFSKEITMIDYGLSDDVSRFVTEIQIPVQRSLPQG